MTKSSDYCKVLGSNDKESELADLNFKKESKIATEIEESLNSKQIVSICIANAQKKQEHCMHS